MACGGGLTGEAGGRDSRNLSRDATSPPLRRSDTVRPQVGAGSRVVEPTIAVAKDATSRVQVAPQSTVARPTTAPVRVTRVRPTLGPTVGVRTKFATLRRNIEMPIVLNRAQNIAGIEIEFHYDPEMVQVEEVIQGKLISDFFFEENISRAGVIKIVAVGANGVSGSGEIATIIFKPLKEGYSKIEVVGVDIADEDINPIEVRGNYGWIVIH